MPNSGPEGGQLWVVITVGGSLPFFSLPIDGLRTKLEVLFLPLYLSFFFSHGPPVTKLEALSSPFRIYLFLKFSLLGLPLHVHPFLWPIDDNQRHKKGRRKKKKKRKIIAYLSCYFPLRMFPRYFLHTNSSDYDCSVPRCSSLSISSFSRLKSKCEWKWFSMRYTRDGQWVKYPLLFLFDSFLFS